MKLKIKQVVFTNKNKDGTPYNRNGKPFFMLHIQLENGAWCSKFYNKKELDPSSKITVWKEYEIEVKVNWEYTNLTSLKDNWNIII